MGMERIPRSDFAYFLTLYILQSAKCKGMENMPPGQSGLTLLEDQAAWLGPARSLSQRDGGRLANIFAKHEAVGKASHSGQLQIARPPMINVQGTPPLLQLDRKSLIEATSQERLSVAP